MSSMMDWGLIKLEHERRIAEVERDIEIEQDPRLKPRRRVRRPPLIQIIIRTFSS